MSALTRTLRRALATARPAPYLLGIFLAWGCESRTPEELITELTHSESDIRRRAAYELVNRGDDAVVPLLHALPSAPDPLRYIGAQVLGRLGDPRAAPILLSLTRDPNPHVRNEAVLALNKIHVPAMKDTLQRILRHNPHAELRASAAETLPGFRDTSVVATLGTALADTSAAVRQSAIAAFGRIWSDGAGPAVVRAMADPDAKVRYIAVQLAAYRPIAGVGEPLRHRLADPSPAVRAEAAHSVALRGDTTAVEALVVILRRYEGADADSARSALRALTGIDYIVE